MCRVSRGLAGAPAISVRQEKKAGWPATTFSNVAASAVIGGSMSWSVAWPALDPFQDVGDGSQDAAQAGIGGERAKEGLRLHEPFRGCRDFLRGSSNSP